MEIKKNLKITLTLTEEEAKSLLAIFHAVWLQNETANFSIFSTKDRAFYLEINKSFKEILGIK